MKSHQHQSGLLRREFLQVGFAAGAGIALSEVFDGRAQANPSRDSDGAVRPAPRARAKSCIIVWMTGGPAQMGTWDPKPDAKEIVRGEYRAISTNVPGVQFCNLLPKTALHADKLAIIRTITLGAEDDNHNIGTNLLMTGLDKVPPGTNGVYQSRNDWPCYGSALAYARPNRDGLPTAVALPTHLTDSGGIFPGQRAGLLGARYDPFRVDRDPNAPDFRVEDVTPPPGLTAERLHSRRALLGEIEQQRRALDRHVSLREYGSIQQKAFNVVTSSRTAAAFDLAKEPDRVRDRYGRHAFGQTLLLARRLVETGVGVVQANMGSMNTWDTHQDEHKSMTTRLMPPFDQGYAALIEDLHQRGLLAETLVVCMAEMGRNPHLGAPTAGGTPGVTSGRNHWGYVWSIALAGGGVQGGRVLGKTDDEGGYPDGEAWRPSDIAATIYSCLGVDPRAEMIDQLGRPFVLNRGNVIAGLL